MPTIKLRRGFVAEANRWAVDLRAELGLLARDPLCPWRLSEHLGIRIFRLSELPDCPERRMLQSKASGHDFSAAACFQGTAAFIVLNDAHDLKRQASDIAHELGHILLRHPPLNPFQADGFRSFSAENELEAERLGPTLLVSDDAALNAYRLLSSRRYTAETLSDAWRITKDVIQMRVNLPGARRRIPQAA